MLPPFLPSERDLGLRVLSPAPRGAGRAGHTPPQLRPRVRLAAASSDALSGTGVAVTIGVHDNITRSKSPFQKTKRSKSPPPITFPPADTTRSYHPRRKPSHARLSPAPR
jgi:hypothetical protein